MPFISASAISPFNKIRGGASGGPAPTVLDFSPYNVWDSENVVISGTTTTFTDFNNVGTAYNLVNPSATNQPAYNASDSDFNNLPSFTFDGVGEYVSNGVSGYRESDSSGMYIGVFRYESGTNFNFFTSAQNNNGIFIRQARFPGTTQYIHRYGGSTNTLETTQDNILDGDVTIQAVAGDGTDWITYNEGGNIPNTIVAGGYKWFDEIPNRTNIGIGASLNSAIRYANISWCMSGYFPYVDDATTLDLISFLNTKYGIS